MNNDARYEMGSPFLRERYATPYRCAVEGCGGQPLPLSHEPYLACLAHMDDTERRSAFQMLRDHPNLVRRGWAEGRSFSRGVTFDRTLLNATLGALGSQID